MIYHFGILFSYSPLDPSFNNATGQQAQNILGITGAKIADLLKEDMLRLYMVTHFKWAIFPVANAWTIFF